MALARRDLPPSATAAGEITRTSMLNTSHRVEVCGTSMRIGVPRPGRSAAVTENGPTRNAVTYTRALATVKSGPCPPSATSCTTTSGADDAGIRRRFAPQLT
jgi:hypothetical protein